MNIQKISEKSTNPDLICYDFKYLVGLLVDSVSLKISKQSLSDDYVEIESRDVAVCSIKMNIVKIDEILQQK